MKTVRQICGAIGVAVFASMASAHACQIANPDPFAQGANWIACHIHNALKPEEAVTTSSSSPSAASSVPVGVYGVAPLPGFGPVPSGTVCSNYPGSSGGSYFPTYVRACTEPDGQLYSIAEVSPNSYGLSEAAYPSSMNPTLVKQSDGAYGESTTPEPTVSSTGAVTGTLENYEYVSAQTLSSYGETSIQQYAANETGSNSYTTMSCSVVAAASAFNPATNYVFGLAAQSQPQGSPDPSNTGGGVAYCTTTFK